MEPIFKMTLTPCRSTGPRRGTSVIVYRRVGDVVEAFRAQQEPGAPVRIEQVSHRSISPSETDPDFEAAWFDHVRAQQAA